MREPVSAFYKRGCWLYAEDSAVGKKGDLMELVYVPGKRIERQVLGPS
jgi:hypothetical protein